MKDSWKKPTTASLLLQFTDRTVYGDGEKSDPPRFVTESFTVKKYFHEVVDSGQPSTSQSGPSTWVSTAVVT